MLRAWNKGAPTIHAPWGLGGRRDGNVVLGGILEQILATPSRYQLLSELYESDAGTHWNLEMNSGMRQGAMTLREGLQAAKASSKRTWSLLDPVSGDTQAVKSFGRVYPLPCPHQHG